MYYFKILICKKRDFETLMVSYRSNLNPKPFFMISVSPSTVSLLHVSRLGVRESDRLIGWFETQKLNARLFFYNTMIVLDQSFNNVEFQDSESLHRSSSFVKIITTHQSLETKTHGNYTNSRKLTKTNKLIN